MITEEMRNRNLQLEKLLLKSVKSVYSLNAEL